METKQTPTHFSATDTEHREKLQADIDDLLDKTHDFEDGKGAVPAHRHVNPDGSIGGWVAETAFVGPKVYLGRDARVFDNARVTDGARVFDNARVCGGALVCGTAQISGDTVLTEGTVR